MKRSGGEQETKSIRLLLRSMILFWVYLIAGGGTILAFQNCSQPEAQKFESLSSTLSEEDCPECLTENPEIRYFNLNHNGNQIVTPGARILVKYSSRKASSVKAVIKASGSCTYKQAMNLSDWKIWDQLVTDQAAGEQLLSVTEDQIGCTFEVCLTALAEGEAGLEPRTSSSFRSRCSSYSVISETDMRASTSASALPQLNLFMIANEKGGTEMWPGQRARVMIKSTNSRNLVAMYRTQGTCEAAQDSSDFQPWDFVSSSSKYQFDVNRNLNFDDTMTYEFNEAYAGCSIEYCVNALKDSQVASDFSTTPSLNSRCQTVSMIPAPKVNKFVIDSLDASGVSRGINEPSSYVVARPGDRLRVEWATTAATTTRMKWKYSGQCGYSNRVGKDAEVWMDMVGMWGVGSTSANNRNVFQIPAANSQDSMLGCSFTYCLTAVHSSMTDLSAKELDGINSKCFHLNLAP